MDQEEIVLVTPNYRLGALGFLSLENDSISGNMGLKDQAMALEWVRDNIGDYSGDPGNVTLMGASAGGISAMNHLVSPMSQGQWCQNLVAKPQIRLSYYALRLYLKDN